MKKQGILNSNISLAIAQMGHTDGMVICDAGLPIPKGINSIDIALTHGIPTFLDTVKAITQELYIEKVLIAEEIKQHNGVLHSMLIDYLKELMVMQGNQILIEYVSHELFKANTHDAKVIVRTGECSPYANVIFYSGVNF